MRFGLLVAAAALALAPASAPAKEKQKRLRLGPVVVATAIGPVATVPATASSATARCPRKLKAVGGGFSAPFASTGALVVNESYRSAPNSWSVSATLVSGAGAATAHAYCRRKGLHIHEVAQSAALPSGSGQSIQAEARCRRGAVPVGGGFQMTSGPEPGHLAIPETSMAAAHSWRVIAQNSSTGVQTVTAHAYCTRRVRAPARSEEQVSGTVALFGALTATSYCRERLSAGGFHSPFATGVLPVHAESRIVGRGFVDAAVNGGSGAGPMTVQSQAICL